MKRAGTLAVLFCVMALGFGAMVFVLPDVVLAQTVDAGLQAAGSAGLGTSNLPLLIARIIRAVIGVLGFLLFCLVVYAGIKYMLARGDKDKVAEARRILKNAALGLLVVFASYAITTFVLNALLRAAGIGRNVTTSSSLFIEPLSGALGAGIVQDHYPPRGGSDIPRNTNIIVTFKEPIFLDSLLQSGSYDDAVSPVVGRLNVANVKIYRKSEGEGQALRSEDVVVRVTEDRKSFVFDPVSLLGSATEPQNYMVSLSPDILKLLPDLSTTAAAFPSGEGYQWGFQVSTLVDVTPPYVQSFVPAFGASDARNVIVQVEFNEPIDPTSVSGVYRPTESAALRFMNVQLRQGSPEGGLVEGRYVISNGYRTLEFSTFDQCGTNACGGDIFCLPGGDQFVLVARAAALGSDPPQALFGSQGYEGIVDAAGNSFDGGGEQGAGKDGVASGPPANDPNSLGGDNFWTQFSTTTALNTDRPRIEQLLPQLNQSDVSIDQPVTITFDQPMRASTLTNRNLGLVARPEHELWYRVISSDVREAETSRVLQTTATIQHGLFRDYQAGETAQLYYPTISQDVTTSYQICFYPAYGPPNDCQVNAASPSCCDGVATASGTCRIPSSP